jgi:hypothetical protein
MVVSKQSNLSFRNGRGGDICVDEGKLVGRSLGDGPGMTAAGCIELLLLYSALRGLYQIGYHGHDLALGSLHASRGVLGHYTVGFKQQIDYNGIYFCTINISRVFFCILLHV